jgi:hypothetical protein
MGHGMDQAFNLILCPLKTQEGMDGDRRPTI